VLARAELLSLQQIRCFFAALELGSFTAAAEALRVSQPAVAEQIRELEQAPVVTRPRPSAGVRQLLTHLEAHMRAVADEFDRSR